MTKHKVKITQVLKTTRIIVVEVEADSLEDAIEQQEADFAPSTDDPRWSTGLVDIVSEEVEAA